MLVNEIIKEESIDKAWLSWYNKFKENKLSIESRDGNVVAECINAITIIDNRASVMMIPLFSRLSFCDCALSLSLLISEE